MYGFCSPTIENIAEEQIFFGIFRNFNRHLVHFDYLLVAYFFVKHLIDIHFQEIRKFVESFYCIQQRSKVCIVSYVNFWIFFSRILIKLFL